MGARVVGGRPVGAGVGHQPGIAREPWRASVCGIRQILGVSARVKDRRASVQGRCRGPARDGQRPADGVERGALETCRWHSRRRCGSEGHGQRDPAEGARLLAHANVPSARGTGGEGGSHGAKRTAVACGRQRSAGEKAFARSRAGHTLHLRRRTAIEQDAAMIEADRSACLPRQPPGLLGSGVTSRIGHAAIQHDDVGRAQDCRVVRGMPIHGAAQRPRQPQADDGDSDGLHCAGRVQTRCQSRARAGQGGTGSTSRLLHADRDSPTRLPASTDAEGGLISPKPWRNPGLTRCPATRQGPASTAFVADAARGLERSTTRPLSVFATASRCRRIFAHSRRRPRPRERAARAFQQVASRLDEVSASTRTDSPCGDPIAELARARRRLRTRDRDGGRPSVWPARPLLS
jgi:hypothetical protein